MKQFSTYGTAYHKVNVGSYHIASIIDEELKNILGDKDRFIENGFIKERDYRFNTPETIREATKEEIELYNSFILVENHFRNLD